MCRKGRMHEKTSALSSLSLWCHVSRPSHLLVTGWVILLENRIQNHELKSRRTCSIRGKVLNLKRRHRSQVTASQIADQSPWVMQSRHSCRLLPRGHFFTWLCWHNSYGRESAKSLQVKSFVYQRRSKNLIVRTKLSWFYNGELFTSELLERLNYLQKYFMLRQKFQPDEMQDWKNPCNCSRFWIYGCSTLGNFRITCNVFV